MCLNRFDTDTKTAFLDLYTKVDADATAPVAPKDDDVLSGVTIETTKDPNTNNLIVSVSRDGDKREVALTETELIEFLEQGMTAEQVIDRAARTLAVSLYRDIPF
jgi:hypothetical protein